MESGPKKALVLIGILSRAINEECGGKEFPTIFIDVRKEADWIYKIMKNNDKKGVLKLFLKAREKREFTCQQLVHTLN